MAQLVPVDHDPFADDAPTSVAAPRLVPVDHDPFADDAPTSVAAPRLVPVDHDPFADDVVDNGSFGGDLARRGIGGTYKATGAALRAAGYVPKLVGDYVTTPVVEGLAGRGTDLPPGASVPNEMGEAPEVVAGSDVRRRTPNLMDPAADAIGAHGEGLQAGASAPSREAIKKSTPSGDLFDPSTWSFGDDPSLKGYLLHGADVLGQMVPVVAAAVATAGAGPGVQLAAGGAAGGAQGGGAAIEEARKAIDELEKAGKLAEQSKVYRDMIAQGRSHAEAFASTRDAAERWAFTLTTPISAVGGAATGALLNPATKILSTAPLAGRVAGRTGIGGVEEGLQEVGESVETKTGINVGAGTNQSVTEGTFADFVLGAIGGGATGAAGGALSRRERAGASERQAQPVAEADLPVGAVPTADADALLPSEQDPAAAPAPAPFDAQAAARTAESFAPVSTDPIPAHGTLTRALSKTAEAAADASVAPAVRSAASES